MKTIFLSVFTMLACTMLAQQPNWGFGEPITVTGTGTITCTVTDPVTHQTVTTTQSNVANYINSQGVVACNNTSGTAWGIIYDANTHRFETELITYSGNTITNTEGVITCVSASGTLYGAVYDPCRRKWETSLLTYTANGTVINKQGVVAYNSTTGTAGGAIYDPTNHQWVSYLITYTGDHIQNSQGVISCVSNSGTVTGAIYDITQHRWESSLFSYTADNTVSNKNGIIAYVSNTGTVGAAAYSFDYHRWDDILCTYSATSGSFSNNDGTVGWTSSTGSHTYGYNNNNWTAETSTALACKFSAEALTGCNNGDGTSYFWCMSRGADAYSYDTDDGHIIYTRRWPWKQYPATGSTFSPQLTISNSNQNSGCSSSISFPNGIANISADYFKLSPNPATDKLRLFSADHSFHAIAIYNAIGQEVFSTMLNRASLETVIDISGLDAGIYFLKIGAEENAVAVKKFVKQ